MGRVTRSPPKPKPRYLFTCNVAHCGVKWTTHQAELWAAVAGIAGADGFKEGRSTWISTAVHFTTQDQVNALRHWIRAEEFEKGAYVAPPQRDPAELASERWLALEWAIVTDQIQPIAIAYRAAKLDGWTPAPANAAASYAVLATRPDLTPDEARKIAHFIIEWVDDSHHEWLWRGIEGDRSLEGY